MKLKTDEGFGQEETARPLPTNYWMRFEITFLSFWYFKTKN